MKKIGIHLLLILLLLAIPIVSSPDFDGTFSVFKVHPFQREFLRFLIAVLFFYVNLYFLLPRYFVKKKYGVYAFSVAVCFWLIVYVPEFITEHWNGNGISPPASIELQKLEETSPAPFQKPFERPNFDDALVGKIFTPLLPFLFSFLLSLFIFREKEKQELEKTKAKTDLLNLKYQLQPHFLFNTLNSIYALALLKSDDAPEGILKLSNVMRYVVQESDRDFVELEKEILYLKDYVAIQLIRTNDQFDFSFVERGSAKDLTIAPMILVNFIENAFKFGFNAEEKSKISIEILIKDSTLEFKVFNSIVNRNQLESGSTGVGLKNTIHRLEEIYKNQHLLLIDENETTFEVNLTLTLTKLKQ